MYMSEFFRDSLPHSGSEDACTQQCDKTIHCLLNL